MAIEVCFTGYGFTANIQHGGCLIIHTGIKKAPRFRGGLFIILRSVYKSRNPGLTPRVPSLVSRVSLLHHQALSNHFAIVGHFHCVETGCERTLEADDCVQ
jgi:hypothetical protein